MTTALYRRYRPETFAEVIGQEQVTSPLSVALNKNRVNHAYLFSGPRGCGKTTSARILARCLNCEQGPTPTPCGTCASCVDLARGGPGSLDVVEIDAASHGGVDDARDLRERAAFAPVRDRYKVFIIDEAHMVSPQGFNALLKIVEEPPEHIRFIFATTEPEKVIGTIRSRTHHYPFRLVPPERLTQYLAELCEREAVPVGKGVLPLVVRAGGGSVRDTLSVLDQLIGGAGEDGLSYATAIGLLGYTDAALLDDVADALAAGDGATVFRSVDRVIESGHDPRRFVEDLLERLRDLLVVAAVRDGGHAVFRGMPDDQLDRMRNQASRFGAAELSRAADVANTALTEMTGATSPRLQLELLCARLLLPAADDQQRGLGARMDRLEKRIGSGAVAGRSGLPVATPAPAGGAVPSGDPGPPGDPAAPRSTASGLAAVRAAIGATGRPAAGSPTADTGTAPALPSAERAPAARSGSEEPPGGSSRPVSDGPVVTGTRTPSDRGDRPAISSGQAPAAPAAAPAAAPGVTPGGPGGGDLEAVRRNWNEVLNAVASIKRATWSLVSQYAQVLDHDGRRLLLGFDSAGRAQSFGRGPHPNFVRQALIEVLGLDCVVEATATSDFRSGRAVGRSAGPDAPAVDRSAAPGPALPPSVRPDSRPTQRSREVAGESRESSRTEPRSAPESSSAWTEIAARPSAPGRQETSNGGSGAGARQPQAPPAGQPRSIGAAAARAAAAAARRQHGQPQHGGVRGAGSVEDQDMPTPQSSPYDDIPPDLTEPVREDEVPPEPGWGGSVRSGRGEPNRSGPAHPVVDLSAPAESVDHSVSDSPSVDRTVAGSGSGATALIGVQAVEQLLGGRVIEERDL